LQVLSSRRLVTARQIGKRRNHFCYDSVVFRLDRFEEDLCKAGFPYAVPAAILYGLHQIFTKIASDRITEWLGLFFSCRGGCKNLLNLLCLLHVEFGHGLPDFAVTFHPQTTGKRAGHVSFRKINLRSLRQIGSKTPDLR